jgi:hypothetical protein
MRRRWILSCWPGVMLLCGASVLSVMSQVTGSPAQEAMSLLDRIEKKMLQRPGWDEPSMAVENPHVLRNTPEFLELQETLQESPHLASSLDTIAPSETSKAIFFMAMQSLPPQDYLHFLEQATTLAETGVVNRRLLKWALLPEDGNVRGIVEYNYTNPVVGSVLTRAKAIYSNEPSVSEYFDAVLAGKIARGSKVYLDSNPREPLSRPALDYIAESGRGRSMSPPSEPTPFPPPVSTNQEEAPETSTPTREAASSFAFQPILAAVIGAAILVGVLYLLGRRSRS